MSDVRISADAVCFFCDSLLLKMLQKEGRGVVIVLIMAQVPCNVNPSCVGRPT